MAPQSYPKLDSITPQFPPYWRKWLKNFITIYVNEHTGSQSKPNNTIEMNKDAILKPLLYAQFTSAFNSLKTKLVSQQLSGFSIQL